MKTMNIGLEVEKPKKECSDINCPFHGSLKVRGRQFSGTVVSAKMSKTAVVEWERRKFLKKFERYEKRRTKIKAHNTSCIGAREGEVVTLMECRPLSKSKNFVIIEKLGSAKGFQEKMRLREEGKTKSVKVEKPIEEDEEVKEEKNTEETKSEKEE
tara:strand:+ start:36 stop:503 length:468 start_codon:yes stop_codon:yes gene_type:complete